MGRAGGGGGGGRSGGGGGGRSSGGRTGGGGSHRSGFGGGGRSSFTGPSRGPSYGHSYGRPYGYGRTHVYHHHHGGYYESGPASLASTIVAGAIVIICLLVWAAVFILGRTGGDITKSTVQREPLPRGSVVETGYYTDELGWIDSVSKLEAGMKNFYHKTGVQPYVYITDNANGVSWPNDSQMDAFANSLYEQLFSDEGHVLLVFLESNEKYKTWYVCGTQAKTVIDQEAADILLDYVDRYYYSDMTESQFFSKAFDDAGKRIMEVTKPAWIPVAVTVGVVVIFVITFIWWNKAKKQRNLEDQQAAAILNAPLPDLGDGPQDEADRVASRYDIGSDT